MQISPLSDPPMSAGHARRPIAQKQPPTSAGWVIVWRISEHCSLACRFCGFSRDIPRSRAVADVRAALGLGKVLAEVQQRLSGKILVTWLGGEPLEWEELPSLARVFHRDFGLALGVTTHGLPLLRQGIRADLLADYEQVTVSIDGLAHFHDRVRGRAGLWGHLRRGVEQLRNEDTHDALWRRVNTVLMRENIGEVVPFFREMSKWGFHELTFNQLGGNDRPEFFPANRLLAEQMAPFRHELAQLRRTNTLHGMIIQGAEAYLNRIDASARNQRLPIQDCAPGRRFLFIDAQGLISPCSFTSDTYGIPIGEIDSAEAFSKLSERFDQERQRRRSPACEDCHANHVFDKFGSDVPTIPAASA